MGVQIQHGAANHRAAAEKIVRALQAAGHAAYFAGGCVRDQLMGREPHDFDVATDAPPQRVVSLFPAAKRVGEAFGVVVVKSLGIWVEVATFRTESAYTDGRHPGEVQYSDAEHDAQRRDFTINGLFYDPVADRVIDHVDGRRDIESCVVRAIGDPADRFAEDYLRMLRAVRFAARFEFEIDGATAAAIALHAPKLKAISRERIGIEVEAMMSDPHRARAARMMQRLGLDVPVLNEAASGREPDCLDLLADEAHAVTALAAWAIDRHIDPPRHGGRVALVDALDRIKAVAIVRGWRKALVLSNDDTELMAGVLAGVPRAVMWPDLNIAQKKRLMARAEWPEVKRLFHAVMPLAGAERFDGAEWEREAAVLEAAGVAPEPWVNGDDLVAAGMTPGPKFKRILDEVYDAQLAGLVTNKEQGMEMARALSA